MKAFLLKQVSILVTTKKLWEDANDIVDLLFDDEITGEEKRQLAFKELRSIGHTLATFLLNLVIEAAYTYLRIKKGL